MKKLILLPLLLTASLYAGPEMSDEGKSKGRTPTKTNPGISEKVETDNSVSNPISDGTDKYGNSAYERVVRINTPSYQVENFWSKISWGGDGQEYSNTVDIRTQGKVRITVEATSLCSIYDELDEEGCSGQKPFLLNNEAIEGKAIGDVISVVFQKDYNGEVPFNSNGILYTDTNDTFFYPLDVERIEKFYKSQPDNTKSFYGFFGRIFNTFFGDSSFGSFFDHKVSDSQGTSVEDIRKRYMTNITAGIDQEHLLAKGSSLVTNNVNTPVSLIDYIENTEDAGSCKLFFFTVSSARCNRLAGIPFIGFFVRSRPTVKHVVDTIQTDTENSIITFASAYSGMTKTEYEAGISYQEESKRSGGFFRNFFKCLFFGCPKVDKIENAMTSSYTFDENEIVNMTLPITNNGTTIDTFQTFNLKAIHSTVANEHTCQIKHKGSGKDWTYSFNAMQADSKGECIENCSFFSRGDPVYGDVPNLFGDNSGWSQNELGAQVPSWWLAKCDEVAENFTGGTHEECSGFFIFSRCETVNDSMTFGKYDQYTIKSYQNKAKRGLILDLELIKLDMSTPATKTRYKIMDVK